MARVRAHLDRTPIVEAVIDFRLRPDKELSIDVIESLASEIDGYHRHGPIVQLETQLSIEKGDAKSSSKSRSLGARLHSEDEKNVLQFQVGGFTMSRLEPYENWESLNAEARRHWSSFLSVIGDAAVTRIATRFINRLELPMQPGEHFEEYLTSPPAVPEELPQTLVGFNQRVVIANEKLGARANVLHSLQEGLPSSDKVPIVLDIDVYRMVEIASNSDEIWDILGRLRVFKNEIFYASLTERTVALYE